MAAYPALVQLFRLLGRRAALDSVGRDHEPDPDQLDDAERSRLRTLIEQRLTQVSMGLVEEAAASDDVVDRPSALDFVRAQLTGFGDLLTEQQATELLRLTESLTAGWS